MFPKLLIGNEEGKVLNSFLLTQVAHYLHVKYSGKLCIQHVNVNAKEQLLKSRRTISICKNNTAHC